MNSMHFAVGIPLLLLLLVHWAQNLSSQLHWMQIGNPPLANFPIHLVLVYMEPIQCFKLFFCVSAGERDGTGTVFVTGAVDGTVDLCDLL